MSGGLYIGGDTSGSVLLYPTPVAGATTITIAAQSGTLNVGGPAFYACRQSNQSISTNTWTKVQLNVEEFDTNNCFDSVTNYRFQPTVAGYYQLNATIYYTGSAYCSAMYTQFYKNGSGFGKYSVVTTSSNTMGDWVVPYSTVAYLNGTTDYIELYGYTNISANPAFYGATGGPTSFSAALVRTA
jgi:hypothetical protein